MAGRCARESFPLADAAELVSMQRATCPINLALNALPWLARCDRTRAPGTRLPQRRRVLERSFSALATCSAR
jgi:hypothetical protein